LKNNGCKRKSLRIQETLSYFRFVKGGKHFCQRTKSGEKRVAGQKHLDTCKNWKNYKLKNGRESRAAKSSGKKYLFMITYLLFTARIFIQRKKVLYLEQQMSINISISTYFGWW